MAGKDKKQDKGLEATSKDPTNIVEALEYICEGKNTEATKIALNYAKELYHAGACIDDVVSKGVSFLEGYEQCLVNHKVFKSFVPFELKGEIKVG